MLSLFSDLKLANTEQKPGCEYLSRIPGREYPGFSVCMETLYPEREGNQKKRLHIEIQAQPVSGKPFPLLTCKLWCEKQDVCTVSVPVSALAPDSLQTEHPVCTATPPSNGYRFASFSPLALPVSALHLTCPPLSMSLTFGCAV